MSTPLLTRAGALDVTHTVDRLANLIEVEASTLGLNPVLVAKLVGTRNADGSVKEMGILDSVSDAVEKKAGENFPLTAGELPPALQKINDEKAAKKDKEEAKKKAGELPPALQKINDEKKEEAKKKADFDPSTIAEQVAGPLESEPDEPYMDGQFTQVDLYEVSEEFGGRLAAATKSAASKLDYVSVQGYDGFTAQIRELDELSTKAASLQAQIDAAVGPLLTTKAGLDADIAKVHKVIKDEYKSNLSAVGNVTIERKTALVEARATLQVVAVKRSLNDVQAELLAAVIEKYGKEVAEFIKTTSSALQDADKQMRVAFKGFELEQKAMQTHTASTKVAGMADLLATFQDWLDKGWKKMVQVAKTIGAMVTRSGASVAKAHDSFMGSLDDFATGKTASSSTSHGFNLFKN